MNIKNIYYTVLCCIFISACGGGSSDSHSSSIPMPTPPLQSTLTIKTAYLDPCGNESVMSDSALLIHNSDYSNKQIIFANANGEMNYTSNNNHETISILSRYGDDVNGLKPISLKTYINHPMIDMGTIYFRTQNTSQCACQTNDIRVTTPSRLNEIGEVSFNGMFSIRKTENNQDYSIGYDIKDCFNVNTEPSLISIMMSFQDPKENYATLISGINHDNVETTILGQPINVTTNVSNKLAMAFIKDQYHFLNASTTPNDIFSFSFDEIDFYSISTRFWEPLYDIPDVDYASFYQASYYRTTNINQVFDLPLIDVNYIDLFSVLTSETGVYNLPEEYDYDYISIWFSASKNNIEFLEWNIIAPENGDVPQIENLDLSEFIEEQDLDSRIDTIYYDLSAGGYTGINGYNDMLLNLPSKKIEHSADEKWNKWNFSSFGMQISDIDFSDGTDGYPSNIISKPLISDLKARVRSISKKEKLTQFKSYKPVNSINKYSSKYMDNELYR